MKGWEASPLLGAVMIEMVLGILPTFSPSCSPRLSGVSRQLIPNTFHLFRFDRSLRPQD